MDITFIGSSQSSADDDHADCDQTNRCKRASTQIFMVDVEEELPILGVIWFFCWLVDV